MAALIGKMAAVKEKSVVKVAVTKEGCMSQFIELNQKKPLAAIIEDVCDVWKITSPENYLLRFDDKKDASRDKVAITEHNRNEIKDGDILELYGSPIKAAENILADLTSGSNEKVSAALRHLSDLAEDSRFAGKFVENKGIPVLIKMVEGNDYNGQRLGFILSAFCDLMAHGLLSWDILEDSFIKQVAANIVKPSGVDPGVLQSSLEILEMITVNGSSKYTTVEKLLPPNTLITHLDSQNQEVQKNTIALINALYRRATAEQQKKYLENLQSKSVRNIIMTNVIKPGKAVGEDMWLQLYILQSLMFNSLQHLRRTPVKLTDSNAEKDLSRLRQAAFESEGTGTNHAKRRSHVAEHKKLGFEHFNDPLEDFTVVPPGLLALKAMTYFAEHHTEDYAKVVMENSCRADDHDLPFAKACIALTELLCDILTIGEQPTDVKKSRLCPMFFTTEHPFEELFCVCVGLLNKTWKEMRATSADFSKVMSVAREQIYRALADRHNSYENFKIKISQLTYAEITKIWQDERKHKEEWASQAKPIKQLREQLRPEIYELIKQQRLNFLIEGSRFKFTSKGRSKEKYWYCKLTPNHKALIYYECNEHGDIMQEETEKKLNVEDFKAVVSGKDCPHVRDNKKATRGGPPTVPPAFSILTEKEIDVISEKEFKDSLNFIALAQEEMEKWVDGLNALLNLHMTSPLKEDDMETLLGMEVKLRLLDTEGITIPESPPAIPAAPPNFDFHYET